MANLGCSEVGIDTGFHGGVSIVYYCEQVPRSG